MLILGFMVRYADVVTGQLRAMRVARESRGFRGGGLRSWPVLARTAGALFVRSYERGERVHRAMLARCYTGSLPVYDARAVTADWRLAMVLPVSALLAAIVLR